MLIIKAVFVSIIILIIGGVLGILISGNALMSEIKKQRKISSKYLTFFTLYDEWLSMKQRGKSVKEYFDMYGYKSVAIYGMGKMGMRFYQELRQEGINVSYVIDRNALHIDVDIECLLPEGQFPMADAIVVTVVNDFKEIKDTLEAKVSYPVVSLEDIIPKA